MLQICTYCTLKGAGMPGEHHGPGSVSGFHHSGAPSRSSGPNQVTRAAFWEFSSRSAPRWTRGCQQSPCTTLIFVDLQRLRRDK